MEPEISNTVIVWSCDKLKYYRMLVGTYREKFLSPQNLPLFLIVTPSFVLRDCKSIYSDSPALNIKNKKLSFKLLAFDYIGEVSVTVISQGKIIKNLVLPFQARKTENFLGEFDFQFITNYDLDIILEFLTVFRTVTIETVKIEEKEIIKNKTPALDIRETDDLSKDFETMLKDEDISDLTIKCKDESIVLQVHKFVLCARSPVFKVMLASPMQEKSSNTVVIDDIDGEVLQTMIHFMYCGRMNIKTMNMASSLLYAAEKYEIKSLKNGIIKYLKAVLCVNNAIEVLMMVELYDEHFKTEVIKYISNNFNKLSHTIDWKELKTKKPVLALDVYDQTYKE